MKAVLTNVRISPKKLNVIAYIVRQMDAKKALSVLEFMPNKGAGIIFKLLTSAVANATHNSQQKVEDLIIDTISISKGIVYKRGNPISRGRSHPILKRTSNALIELKVK